jgi:hypothetical protein
VTEILFLYKKLSDVSRLSRSYRSFLAVLERRASPVGARMTQQNQKPTANTPMSERGHSDPPGLWATVVLSSLVIHLFVLGMLRLWLMVRIYRNQAARNLIPVDVIAQASEASVPLQPTPTTTSVATTNLPSVNTPTKTPKPVPNSQTASTSLQADSPKTNTSPSVTQAGKQTPSPKQSPTVKKSPATNPSQKPSPGTPTQKPSPDPIPSPNNPSGTQPSPSKPDLSINNGKGTNGSSTSPSPNPVASTGSGGILISSTGTPDPISNNSEILHPNDPNYNDKLASLLEGNSQLSAAELKPLGITVDQDLALRVVVIIESTGKATLAKLPWPQKQAGNLSVDKATQLADKSIAKLRFNPTLMDGKPVDRDYSLTLKISPIRQ